MHTHSTMTSSQEPLSWSSTTVITKTLGEDKDFRGMHGEHMPAGLHSSPEIIEDVRDKGLFQSNVSENMSSPVATTVLTSISEDSRDQFENSVLQLTEQDELETAVNQDNSSSVGRETNNGTDDIKIQFNRSGGGNGGFLEGLFGCLKPVWNIIGKAYSTDYKLQQQGKLLWQNHIFLWALKKCFQSQVNLVAEGRLLASTVSLNSHSLKFIFLHVCISVSYIFQ